LHSSARSSRDRKPTTHLTTKLLKGQLTVTEPVGGNCLFLLNLYMQATTKFSHIWFLSTRPLKVTSRLAAEEPFVSQSKHNRLREYQIHFRASTSFLCALCVVFDFKFFFFHIESTYNLPTLKPQPSRWDSETFWVTSTKAFTTGASTNLVQLLREQLQLSMNSERTSSVQPLAKLERLWMALAGTNWALLFGMLENLSTSSERRTLAHQLTELVNGSKNILEK
jgi:hypothetical protein